ncbi:MAG: hypothetical protein AB7I30_22440 [Isosphaeraceae bacterium]
MAIGTGSEYRTTWHARLVPQIGKLFSACSLLCLLAGCGGGDTTSTEPVATAGPTTSAIARPLSFIGFDASPPLISALRSGKIQGLVVQNPLVMGETGVRTLVEHLEK